MTKMMQAPYMHWAKTRFQAQARWALTNSGVMNFPISELRVRLEDLELSGPSYYGYPPLLDALENLPHWPDRVRAMQTQWLGRSEGAVKALHHRTLRQLQETLREP